MFQVWKWVLWPQPRTIAIFACPACQIPESGFHGYTMPVTPASYDRSTPQHQGVFVMSERLFHVTSDADLDAPLHPVS